MHKEFQPNSSFLNISVIISLHISRTHARARVRSLPQLSLSAVCSVLKINKVLGAAAGGKPT